MSAAGAGPAPFSPAAAAVHGLRLAGRMPAAVAAWTVIGFLASLITSVALSLLVRADLVLVNEGDQDAGLVYVAALARTQILALLLLLLPMALVFAAVYRAILRPGEGRWAHLALGPDEARLFGVLVLTTLAGVAPGLTVFAGAIWALGSAGAAIDPAALMRPAVMPAIMIAASAAGLAVVCWFGVRLSLVAPMAFAEGRIRLGAAWRLTRARFWPLLGCLALSWVIAGVLYLAALLLAALVASMVGGVGVEEAWTRAQLAESMGLEAIFTPAQLAYMATASVFSGLTYVVLAAPAAVAYRAFAPSPDIAETFA